MTKHFIDPLKEAQAVTSIRETLAAMALEDDATLLLDSIEGETSFFETIDTIMDMITDDQAMVDAIKAQESALKARRDRFAKRAEFNKALIEQAWIAADLPKVERPQGTIYLSNRAPKVVIETESDIPARYWKPSDPVLDNKLLGDDLKALRDGLEAVLANTGEMRAEPLAALHQRFLDDQTVAALNVRLADLDTIPEDDAKARETALNGIRRDYGSLPGATLSAGSRSLSIRVA